MVLVTAPWSLPAAPARTVLAELARRWNAGDSADPEPRHLVIDGPSAEQLAEDGPVGRLGADVVPMWVLLERAEDGADIAAEDLEGEDVQGNPVRLEGPWTVLHRRAGALPKHQVDEEFGPQACRTDQPG